MNYSYSYLEIEKGIDLPSGMSKFSCTSISSAADDHDGLCRECGCIAPGGCLLIEEHPSYTCEIGLIHTMTETDCFESTGIFCEGRPEDQPAPYFATVAWSPDGAHLASAYYTADDGHGADPDQGNCTAYSASNTSHLYSVAWSPDGGRLASGAWDGTISIWDSSNTSSALDTGHTSPVRSVAWSPDGQRIASAAGTTVQIWDSADLSTALDTGDDHASAAVLSVAWSPDGAHLASAAWDGSVKLWDSTNLSMAIDKGNGHAGWVWSVAWSPDGTRIACGSSDGSVFFWSRVDLSTALAAGRTRGRQCTLESPPTSRGLEP